MELVFDFNRLVPPDGSRSAKDERHRVQTFVTWAQTHAVSLDTLSLAVYRSYLSDQCGFAPTTVKSHLSSIRGQIKKLLNSSAFAGAASPDIANQATRLAIILATDSSVVQTAHPVLPRNLHLTTEDIHQLFDRLSNRSLIELRDAAIISLMVATGIRESEVVALQIADLRCEWNTQMALHVPKGRGCAERLIPYGKMDWVLQVVDIWLQASGIDGGAVFRGFYKSGLLLRNNPLSSRAVELLLKSYPITQQGQAQTVRPLDLRHWYARHLFHIDLDIDTIQKYLGLRQRATVLNYLGSVSRGYEDSSAGGDFRISWLP